MGCLYLISVEVDELGDQLDVCKKRSHPTPKAHRCRDAERRHWVHCPKGGKENRETSDLPKRFPESLQVNPKPKHV